jgi:hypothetical protein
VRHSLLRLGEEPPHFDEVAAGALRAGADVIGRRGKEDLVGLCVVRRSNVCRRRARRLGHVGGDHAFGLRRIVGAAQIGTRESLDRELVQDHVRTIMDGRFGQASPDIKLPRLETVQRANHRLLQRFGETVKPLVLTWCEQNQTEPPAPWVELETLALVREVESSGLLDFDQLDEALLPAICQRAGCWPEGMGRSANPADHGLLPQDVKDEFEKLQEARRQAEVARRSISFVGTSLDTGDPDFPSRFAALAEEVVHGDSSWLTRSRRRFELQSFTNEERDASRPDRIGGRGPGRGRQQPPDAVRLGMGFAGEWLAYQWLAQRHGTRFAPTAWISRNRRFLFSDDEGTTLRVLISVSLLQKQNGSTK